MNSIVGEEADVIVVGGGPAGASAASWLAQNGASVVLLDRATFPRDKPCGEFLTPQAHALLVELGAWQAVSEAGARPVCATVLHAPDGTILRHAPLRGGPAGYALRRTTLDDALLQFARMCGVRVIEGFRVRDILRDESGQAIGVRGVNAADEPVSHRARLTIGADGTHSLLARQLGLVRPLARLQRVAVVAHFQGVIGPCDTIEMRASGSLVCGVGFPGGPSDLPTANVTFVMPTRAAANIAGRAAAWTQETLQTLFPDLAQRLSGANIETPVRTVGCFGHVSRPCYAPGALLVGDAATFVDPFTGEGVYFALRGAQLVAQTALDALRANDVSSRRLSAYAHARGELRLRYQIIAIIQGIVRNPILLNHALHRLKRHPAAADRLLGVLSDTHPPHEAFHPALLWRLVAPEMG